MTTVKALTIMGIAVRTTNQNNQAAQDMAALWTRFVTENIAEKIPHVQSGVIFSIYTDYEKDFTGPYTAILGMEVSSLCDVPEGLIARQFPEENFEVFTAKGKMPDAVVETWQGIWRNDAALNRKYTYDFERYSEKSQLESNAEVTIYIALEN
ncbi:GyrI-like domain-containing protein [Sphingobacterium sp. Mn56C]|uniref:GyrI-like domain-containing protein n=1 Tax=Sphingobacterium sp. Mn56C TaxID=3395261 RepID=UPI003BCDC5B8